MPDYTYVSRYSHLTTEDLVPPGVPGIFFEPADTEIGVWVVRDLLPDGGGSVLDLGSGSGAAAAAMARAGAARVHGIDASTASVEWARRHHARHSRTCRVTFALGDFALLGPEELLATAEGPLPEPLIVTSNPPYVPLAPEAAALRRSISGGPDGLKWAAPIVGHAQALGTDLGFTFGSYSSPAHAVGLLQDAGYEVVAVTLCPLPLGDFTREHPEQMEKLVARGEAVLWDEAPVAPGYFIVGLACRRRASPHGNGPPDEKSTLSGESLMELLRVAATSRTTRLEALDTTADDLWPGSVRVFDPPVPEERHHW
ncbi:methyltransferase domain-containing protein [Streptomyces iconiensis]|uniref:Methyltransferase domain-containing protein n=1 Tax=Streptomyces iconiensis TaxID=1384038 RepID=A0ABT6ZRL1_9ACTN|nr:methyltransferase domain-containing protein [Streptomyces iconiensis]MDJ1131424.1 methyltransferase domain-containing protein [Streptomyces iconiensis]